MIVHTARRQANRSKRSKDQSTATEGGGDESIRVIVTRRGARAEDSEKAREMGSYSLYSRVSGCEKDGGKELNVVGYF